MGKQGPCCHCGISTTPLWRNGPPEKPVLCNACGSRWKTKGTLLNYMPMHSGGFGVNMESGSDLKWSRGRKGFHKHAEQWSRKRKEPCDNGDRENGPVRSVNTSSTRSEEEITSISSSRDMPGSESSIRHSFPSLNDPPVIGPRWDIPSKKRSAILRHPASVDKLTKSLMSLLLTPPSMPSHESSSFSEALLVEYSKPSLMTSEIGLGSIFVRQPVSIAQESESETSSFLTPNRTEESFSESGSVLLNHSGSDKGSTVRGKEQEKRLLRKPDGGTLHSEKILTPNETLLENFPYKKHNVLQSRQSPLVYLDLKDIVNFDVFKNLLTEEEQGYLKSFVLPADLARLPESLKCMLSSPQFEGALANFQQLLSKGMFDSSQKGLSPDILQHYQQLLTITDLTSSGWLEQCSQLQNQNKHTDYDEMSKVIQTQEWSRDNFERIMPVAAKSASEVEDAILDVNGERFSGTSSFTMPGSLLYTSSARDDLAITPEIAGSTHNAIGEKAEGVCSPSSNLFFPGIEREATIGGHGYMDIVGIDTGETDSLLFDIPNSMSFQQAELLQQPNWTSANSAKEEENDGAQLESGGLIMSNTRHMDTSPAEWGMFWNSSCVGLPNGAVLNPGRMLM